MPSTASARRRARARESSRAGRRRAAAVVVLAAYSLSGVAPSGAEARQACAAASAAPGSVAGVTLRRALRCEVNAERARHGLRPLRASRRLGAAARGHARDMVSHAYFAHERPGSTLLSRVRAAGWTGSFVGEAIAWGLRPAGRAGGGARELAGEPAAPRDRTRAPPPCGRRPGARRAGSGGLRRRGDVGR